MDNIVKSLDSLNLTQEKQTIHTIVLLNVPLTDDLRDLCEKKKLVLIDPNHLKESASVALFNDNKYFGTICYEVSKGNTVVIPHAKNYINKKGNLTLTYHLISRLKGTSYDNYNFVVISDTSSADAKGSEGQLLTWASKYAKCLTMNEFEDTEISKVILDKPYELKVTCGLLTKHVQEGKVVMGHVTRDYNVSIKEAKELEESNKKYLGKTYKATIVRLTLVDTDKEKPAGSILYLPDLGEFSHVTNNTTIKSALSKAVLNKFSEGVLEFNLQEIDSAAKINPKIVLTQDSEVDVEVIGWYCYALESK